LLHFGSVFLGNKDVENCALRIISEFYICAEDILFRVSSVLFFDCMVKRFYFSVFFFGLFFSQLAFSIIPAGYYDGSDGLMKVALKSKLYNIISKDASSPSSAPASLSYAELWTAFRTTDVRADGKVWDIYSNSTNFVFGTNQCGNYQYEGDCYNREHSFPKSWFGGEIAPMYTDLFHLYPSDGKVNGVRSNYPFGNVFVVTNASNNSYSLLGTSTESGSSLTVFEPADELKGDMARTYFYMVTRYENLVASWKSNLNTEMLGGNSYPAFSNWAISVLLEWSRLDPVSAKERVRNDAIYTNFQHNRNPFIDFPSLAEYVWGDSTTYAFHPSTYLAVSSTKKEGRIFTAWSEKGNLHVRSAEGSSIEIMDVTGNVLIHSIANQAESTFLVGMNKLVFVRVDNQVQKVVL